LALKLLDGAYLEGDTVVLDVVDGELALS